MKSFIRSLCLLCLVFCGQASAQGVAIPPAEVCFQATAGISGMVGLLGAITGGTGGTAATYINVPLTGGYGNGATANITVAGGAVTAVTIVAPGVQYVVGDVLSAASGNIGGVAGFSVPIASTSINSSLAGGSVGMYVPGTLNYSQTWQDAGETILNTNPVGLDANGCALMYGGGTYRQILYDNLQNVVWDRPTTTPPINPVWAGTATGTANAILASAPGFGFLNGQGIDFIAAFNNTGPVTVNGFPVVTNGSSGTQALPAGDIVAGNLIQVVWSQTAQQFYLINGAIPSSLPPIHFPGEVVQMRTQTCPAGTLPEDGTSYLATSYVALFNAIGYTWGGSGANFNVPNAGGQFNRGWESGQAVDSGRTFGTTQLDEFQGHTFRGYVGQSNSNPTGVTSSSNPQSGELVGSPITDGTNGTPRYGTETRPTNITALSCIVTGLLP
jgi:hypothetical protein